MRVNVYAEELTDRVELVTKTIDGREYTAVRFYLELPATVDGKQYKAPFMHRPGDDDSSAVTFWGKRDLRGLLVKALALLDEHYGSPAPIVRNESTPEAREFWEGGERAAEQAADWPESRKASYPADSGRARAK